MFRLLHRIKNNKFCCSIIIFIFLFILISPLTYDFYNTENIRNFLDYFFQTKDLDVNINDILVGYRDFSWFLDWPYPPITIPLIFPAWFIHKFLFSSEFVYQLFFKLPMAFAVLLTSFIIYRQTGSEIFAARYVYNPGIILLSVIWGGFDVILGLIIILMVWSYSKHKYCQAYVLLSFAITLRIYPIVLLPFLLLRQIKRKRLDKIIAYFFIAMFIPVASFIFAITYSNGVLVDALIKQQSSFGPLGIYPVFYALIYFLQYFGIFIKLKYITNFLYLLLLLCELALILYLLSSSKKYEATFLITVPLLLLYLIYPKMHALYILALLPIGFIDKKMWLVRFVWLPDFIWAILVNGFEDVRGLFYWFYWLSDVKFSFIYNDMHTILLSVAREILIGLVIYDIFTKSITRRIEKFIKKYPKGLNTINQSG